MFARLYSVYVAVSFFLCTSPLIAAAYKPCEIEEIEEPKEEVRKIGRKEVCHPCPAKLIHCGCPWAGALSASFLYWEAIQENMEPATLVTASTVATTITRDIQNLNFGFKPGYRIAVGTLLDHDHWEIQFAITHLGSKVKKSQTVSNPTEFLFYPRWLNSGVASLLGDVSSYNATWLLNMNLLDLALIRLQCAKNCLHTLPHIGIRAATIQQQEQANYYATSSDVGVVTSGTKSWSVGPRIGVETNWTFCNCLDFFSDGSLDILYTQYNYKSVNQILLDEVNIYEIDFSQKNIQTIRAHLDIQTGFGWKCNFKSLSCCTDLSLAYNFQVFFNQNMFRYVTASGSSGADDRSIMPNGNLYIQGLTLTASTHF